MKILVCISNVPDTTSKINFTANNSEFDKNGVQFVINPYDEFGLTRAMWLKEKQGAQITVLNVGRAETEPTLRKALAIGTGFPDFVCFKKDNLMKEEEGFFKNLYHLIGVEAKTNVYLDKIEKQRELVNSISSEVTKSVIIDIEEKVGRVISKKNKIIITKAVEALNNAAIALEKLLDLSETPEGDKTIPTPVKAKENGEVKGREPKKVVKQKLVEANDIVLRALKTIAKNSNFALNKLNRK